jgi:hypothetical protein
MKTEISLDNTRSYATEKALRTGLEHFKLDHYRKVICRRPDGRWTAIFSFAHAQADFGESYVGFAAQHGFQTL